MQHMLIGKSHRLFNIRMLLCKLSENFVITVIFCQLAIKVQHLFLSWT